MTTRVRKVTAKAAATAQRTVIGIALDSSGSMHRIRYETVSAFDSIVAGIKEQAKASGIETEVALVTFADGVNFVHQATPADKIPSLVGKFNPDGQTALFDGVMDTIKLLKPLDSENTSFLIYCITDGGENGSRRYRREDMQKAMKELQATGRWTFAFQVPPRGTGAAVGIGVDPDNIREWETSAKGMIETAQVTNSATAKFYATKSAGGAAAKVSNIFTTDLSKLSAKVVHTKLDDISDHFKEYEVKDECRADEFTVKKTKKDYVIGQTFYQLMKKETIQPTKQVLLKEKGKQAIWGGEQARELIGLPKASSGVSIKVEPGNHANYDVFVQSTSINRKLPRGTKVLIDVTMKKSLSPTWDHTVLAVV